MELTDYIDAAEGRDDLVEPEAAHECFNCGKACDELHHVPEIDYMGCEDCLDEAMELLAREAAGRSCTRQSARFWPRPAAAPASTAKPRSPAGIRSTAATSASRRFCVPCVRRWRNMAIASIGNGLYARTRDKLSLLEQYRKLQAECPHAKRDPRGMCYRCGHKENN